MDEKISRSIGMKAWMEHELEDTVSEGWSLAIDCRRDMEVKKVYGVCGGNRDWEAGVRMWT